MADQTKIEWPHGQSRRMSLVEQFFNVGSGVLLSLLVGQIVYPLFGYPVSLMENMGLTAIFTVVSVMRGYVWRRIFNRLHFKEAAHG